MFSDCDVYEFASLCGDGVHLLWIEIKLSFLFFI
jgi:hypothetical protein